MTTSQKELEAKNLEEKYGKFDCDEFYETGRIVASTNKFIIEASQRLVGNFEVFSCTTPTSWERFVADNYQITATRPK